MSTPLVELTVNVADIVGSLEFLERAACMRARDELSSTDQGNAAVFVLDEIGLELCSLVNAYAGRVAQAWTSDANTIVVAIPQAAVDFMGVQFESERRLLWGCGNPRCVCDGCHGDAALVLARSLDMWLHLMNPDCPRVATVRDRLIDEYLAEYV